MMPPAASVGLWLTNPNTVSVSSRLSFSGVKAGEFSVESEAGTPLSVVSIEPRATRALRIRWSPPAAEPAEVDLTFSELDPGAPPQSLRIAASVRSGPLAASLSTGVEQPDGGFARCGAGTDAGACQVLFPDTVSGRSRTTRVRVENLGCEPLSVIGLELEDVAGREGPSRFEVESPNPSVPAPLVLGLDGPRSVDAVIRFSASDGPGRIDARQARLLVKTSTNPRPVAPPAVLEVLATGLDSALDVDPTCRARGPANRCVVSASNRVPEPIRIERISFDSTRTGTSPRFTVDAGRTDILRAPIPIEVIADGNPLFVIDAVTLEAFDAVDGGLVGSARFEVLAGIEPCLNTVDEVSFATAGPGVSTRSIRVSNEHEDGGTAGCGTLLLSTISLGASPVFSLLAPVPAGGTQLTPGQSVDLTLQYTAPTTGGMSAGRLRLATNDPRFGPPAGTKEVLVTALTPFDAPPIAELTVCSPAQLQNDPTCAQGPSLQATFSLGAFPTTPRVLTLSAVNSTDSDGVTLGRPAEYQFRLNTPLPASAMASDLSPNSRGPADRAQLVLSGPGLYRLSLTVWDRANQASQPVTLNLNVTP